jgi:hypothetical protein
MLVAPLPIETFVRTAQFWNADDPILVTLSGIVMLVRLWEERNASPSIPVTGKPLIAGGMVRSPALPLYPEIIMALLLV